METLHSLEEGAKELGYSTDGKDASTSSTEDLARRITTHGSIRQTVRAMLVLLGLPMSATASSRARTLALAYLVPTYRTTMLRSRAAATTPQASAVELLASLASAGTSPTPPTPDVTVDSAKVDIAEITSKVRVALAPDMIELCTDITRDAYRYTDKVVEDKVEAARTALLSEVQEAAKAYIDSHLPPRTIEVKRSEHVTVNIGLQHAQFPQLLRACTAIDHKGNRLNIWLTGSAGSGKTSAAEAVSKALNLDFRFDGALDADYRVLGFRDAAGGVAWTSFRHAFVNGGVYVADEIDSWHPQALLALNAALANGVSSFPDGVFRRHPDCVVIACANTWGHGATSDYVGRAKLDAASLDRFFPKIDWKTDERLETEIARQMAGDLGIIWAEFVQGHRQRVREQGLRVVVTPRMTFSGISLLLQGFEAGDVVDMTAAAGLSPEQRGALRLPLCAQQLSAAVSKLTPPAGVAAND